MSVNVTAPVLCTKYAVQLMKSQEPRGGKIINNGSIAAYTPRPGTLIYLRSVNQLVVLTKHSDCLRRYFVHHLETRHLRSYQMYRP
jgi:NAD(P)-dependent dehydrogenase (short-subunit alcohol dehydrogenase family)